MHIIATGKDDEIYAAAERLAEQAERSGLRVLYDDRRGASAGVKFNDSELIGVGQILVVGRGLADGLVELKDRATGDRVDVPVDEAIAVLTERLA